MLPRKKEKFCQKWYYGIGHHPFVLYLCYEEHHIEWQCQQLSVATDIIIAKFQCLCDVVMFRVLEYGLHGLSISGSRFAFQRAAFPFVADKEVKFQTAIFLKVVKLSSHFAQEAGTVPGRRTSGKVFPVRTPGTVESKTGR